MGAKQQCGTACWYPIECKERRCTLDLNNIKFLQGENLNLLYPQQQHFSSFMRNYPFEIIYKQGTTAIHETMVTCTSPTLRLNVAYTLYSSIRALLQLVRNQRYPKFIRRTHLFLSLGYVSNVRCHI